MFHKNLRLDAQKNLLGSNKEHFWGESETILRGLKYFRIPSTLLDLGYQLNQNWKITNNATDNVQSHTPYHIIYYNVAPRFAMRY